MTCTTQNHLESFQIYLNFSIKLVDLTWNKLYPTRPTWTWLLCVHYNFTRKSDFKFPYCQRDFLLLDKIKQKMSLKTGLVSMSTFRPYKE